jgi:hypothetical protein
VIRKRRKEKSISSLHVAKKKKKKKKRALVPSHKTSWFRPRSFFQLRKIKGYKDIISTFNLNGRKNEKPFEN